MLSNRIGFCLTEAVQRLDRRLAGFVDAARVGGGGPLQLALATQIGFEFGEHAQHVDKRLTHGDAGVDRLFGRLQRVLIKNSWSKIETRAQP
jgi:hypothetical protein